MEARKQKKMWFGAVGGNPLNKVTICNNIVKNLFIM
jgi:hypothetical protein